MQYKPVPVTGICFPGATPAHNPRLRIVAYVVIFCGVLALIAAGVDVHTAAVTVLAAGYVASEIAQQVMHARGSRGAMPVTG